MVKTSYMGYTFIPYGNIIGKDEETRFHRLMWRTDTLSPILSKADGYDYEVFNKTMEAAADIYFCPETKNYYVPTGGGLCSIDFAETKRYIKLLPQDNDHYNHDSGSLYSLDAMKKVLGDEYVFHQSKTADEIKRILETGEIPDNDNVPIVLQAGNLDIEMTINNFGMGVISEDGIESEPLSLEYFCCVRKNGKWESFEEIPDTVDLDVPNIETEMFRALEKFADERALSFFASNDDVPRHGQPYENEDEMEM